MTTLGSLAHEMGDESVGKVGVAQLFADGNALDDVALQASTRQNIATVGFCDDGIIVHLVEPQLIGLEEPFHLPSPQRHGQGNTMDFIIHHAHIRQ